jgi:uncharacterized protein YlaN (UPF0358 family)
MEQKVFQVVLQEMEYITRVIQVQLGFKVILQVMTSHQLLYLQMERSELQVVPQEMEYIIQLIQVQLGHKVILPVIIFIQ